MGYISVAPAAPVSRACIAARPDRRQRTTDHHSPLEVSRQRQRIEESIEALIALLDALDGDPDVEPNGDEHDFTDTAEEDCEALIADRGPGTIEDAEEDNEDCSELEHAAAWSGV